MNPQSHEMMVDGNPQLRELLISFLSALILLTPEGEPRSQRANRARFAGWTLDLATRRLTDADGTVVAVPHTEFALLLAFLDHPRQVLSREQLAGHTGAADAYTTVRTLDVYVSRLRRRLRSGPRGPNIIGTRRNLGYVFDTDPVFG